MTTTDAPATTATVNHLADAGHELAELEALTGPDKRRARATDRIANLRRALAEAADARRFMQAGNALAANTVGVKAPVPQVFQPLNPIIWRAAEEQANATFRAAHPSMDRLADGVDETERENFGDAERALAALAEEAQRTLADLRRDRLAGYAPNGDGLVSRAHDAAAALARLGAVRHLRDRYVRFSMVLGGMEEARR